jgi:hypothetical protein
MRGLGLGWQPTENGDCDGRDYVIKLELKKIHSVKVD